MFRITWIAIILYLFAFSCGSAVSKNQGRVKQEAGKFDYAIVIHGGAGFMTLENMQEEKQKAYEMALDSALDLGLGVLEKDGSALDAVENVIRLLEDNALFNAGKGAVFTSQGKNELDASIMDGSDLEAGAVAGVTDIKNPISAARAVMEQSVHVMLAGEGASQFAAEKGLEIVDPSYFYTPESYQKLHRELQDKKHGTVGCVALDKSGNLAAGTSTGGMTNKRYGRVGDSPVIGAGTYANNNTCGVSATGHGEYFIRYSAAHDISALMEYKGMTVEEAATEVVMKKLKEAGGNGGVICLDKDGHPAMIFNTTGMFRAYGNSDGERMVAIFKED
jgi:beta-aspartyl-peptidase (threonine type)